MGRALVVVAVLGVALLSASLASAERVRSWPTTLLEHTAIAGNSWAPTPRTRLEKMQLANSQRVPEALGSGAQLLFAGADARGHADDSAAAQRENAGRAREPIANHFDDPLSSVLGGAAPPSEPSSKRGCKKDKPEEPCKRNTPEIPDTPSVTPSPVPPPPGPVPPPPTPVPPPPSPPLPPKPETGDYPSAPNPEGPLPPPPKPSCGGLCNPKDTDPILARVPAPPFGDENVGAVGAEGQLLGKIMAKLRNREQWLRAQRLWLTKAVEAAATVRREIELAEMTKNAVASELNELLEAQDHLSIKYKADRLKWAFKDRKITLESLRERLEELEHAKADVKNQLDSAKREVTVLRNTLGKPSEQVQITPEELDDPLKFLEDVEPEDPLA